MEEKNLVIFLHMIKYLGNQKEKEEDRKRLKVSKLNPNPHFLVFELGKTPNLNKNVFIGFSKLFLVV